MTFHLGQNDGGGGRKGIDSFYEFWKPPAYMVLKINNPLHNLASDLTSLIS